MITSQLQRLLQRIQMKSQRVRGAEGEDPMEFGMQHPLSSRMHKSTEKLPKAVLVRFLWRFYYVGVVDKIEHWWFSPSPAPPALMNFSRKGMYGQDIRRQNGKAGNLHSEYGLEQGALGSQNQWSPTIPARLAFPDAHWFWGFGCELLSLSLGHLGPCRILFLLLLLPNHSTWVAEFKSTFCCLRGSGSKWVDFGAWLYSEKSLHRTSPQRKALEKSEEKSPILPPLRLYYCI